MNQIAATDHNKARKTARAFDLHDLDKSAPLAQAGLSKSPAPTTGKTSPTPSLSERSGTEDATMSSYNLRHKSSQSGGSVQGDDSLLTANLPGFSLSPLEKNNPQNAIMDCPFCQKSGYCGLPGIRTHIRNYCPSIDKMIWREKFLKCVLFNIQKYEELNRQPDANTDYNNQVIALLKAKSTPDDASGVRKGASGKTGFKELLAGEADEV